MSKAERDKRYLQTEKGKESRARKNKKYRDSLKGKIKTNEVLREWRENNKDRSKKIDEKYRQSENGKEIFRIKTQRYRARKNELPATLTLIEWKQILDEQEGRCLICKREFSEKLRPTQDHIIPVSKGGSYTKENIQALCGSCNSRKSNK